MKQQLNFDLQALPSSGIEWDVELSKAVFEDEQYGSIDALPRLVEGFFWKGSISREGGIFRLQGAWRTRMIRHCVRCNIEFPMLVEGECDRYFRLGDCADEPEDSEACECLTPPGPVDLVDLLREEVWLTWKQMVVCSRSCRGLCQQCGKNLNRHECGCSQDGDDHPLAALRQIRFDS